MTILEKLYTLRCNRATEELNNRKRKITDIAYISGFESPFPFRKGIQKLHRNVTVGKQKK